VVSVSFSREVSLKNISRVGLLLFTCANTEEGWRNKKKEDIKKNTLREEGEKRTFFFVSKLGVYIPKER
jgi:hypothetical protein